MEILSIKGLHWMPFKELLSRGEDVSDGKWDSSIKTGIWSNAFIKTVRKLLKVK